MFYQEDLCSNKPKPNPSLLNYSEKIQTTPFLQVTIDSNPNIECIQTYSLESLDSSDYSQDNNSLGVSCDNSSNDIDFFKYSIKSKNQNDLSNIQILNDKVQELNKKINFLNLHSININPQINHNIASMIDNFDTIITQINSDIIAKGQLTPKSTKNIGSKKIFEYEL